MDTHGPPERSSLEASAPLPPLTLFLPLASAGASIFLCVGHIVAYLASRRLRRHPASLVLGRTLYDLVFCVQLGYQLLAQKSPLACKTTATLMQFSMLASECCFLAISFDLRTALANPFHNYRSAARTLHGSVLALNGAVAGTLAWLQSGGTTHCGFANASPVDSPAECLPIWLSFRQLGGGADSLIALCWVRDARDGSVNWRTSVFLFLPVLLIYAYALHTYLAVAAVQLRAGGLRSALETRRAVLERQRRLLFLYLAFVGLQSLPYLALFLLTLASTNARPPAAWLRSAYFVAAEFFLVVVGARGAATVVGWSLADLPSWGEALARTQRAEEEAGKEEDATRPELNNALREELLYFTVLGVERAVMFEEARSALAAGAGVSAGVTPRASFSGRRSLNLDRPTLETVREAARARDASAPEPAPAPEPAAVPSAMTEPAIVHAAACAVDAAAEGSAALPLPVAAVVSGDAEERRRQRVSAPLPALRMRTVSLARESHVEWSTPTVIDRSGLGGGGGGARGGSRAESTRTSCAGCTPTATAAGGEEEEADTLVRVIHHGVVHELTSDGVPARASPMRLAFHEYHPARFRRIRRRLGISACDYLDSLREKGRERFSEGASGAFLFFTRDGRFIVKTCTRAEARTLHQLAPAYEAHLAAHPSSLVSKILGCYKMELYGRSIRVLVMANVLHASTPLPPAEVPAAAAAAAASASGGVADVPPAQPPVRMSEVRVHERYDLKGSWVNRRAPAVAELRGLPRMCRYCERRFVVGDTTPCEHRFNKPCAPDQQLKDNDLQYRLNMRPALARALAAQLRADVAFLTRVRVMDYSLLLGVTRGRFDVRSGAAAAAAARGSAAEPSGAPAVLGAGAEGEVPSLGRSASVASDSAATLTEPLLEQSGRYEAEFIHGPQYYYIGIIDILQSWDLDKKREYVAKILAGRNRHGISCVPPAEYAERFVQRVVAAIVEGRENV